MDLLTRLGAPWEVIGTIIVSAVCVYVAVIVLTRRAGLRLNGLQRREQVRAVIVETTGDMGVRTGDGDCDEEMLAGVRGRQRLRGAVA